MAAEIRSLVIADYPAVRGLWLRTPGIGLNESDSLRAVDAFLSRNPDLSAVAIADDEIIGAVLCGHDGRRGYLHHLAVDTPYRGQGIANQLLSWCFGRLAQHRIPKCNIFLIADNEDGAAFWQHNGWLTRPDLRVLQKPIAVSG